MSGLSKDTPIPLLEFPGSEASMKLCLFPKNAKRIDYAVVLRFGISGPSEAMELALKRCGFKVGNNRLWRFEFPDADSLKAIPELGSALGASVKIMTYARMVKEGLVLDFRNGPVTSWNVVVKKEAVSGKVERIRWAKTRDELLAQILPYAQDFTSLSEWQKGHPASHAKAVIFQDEQGKGLTREVGLFLGWNMNEEWANTRDELLAQILPYAQDFTSLSEWANGHHRSYQRALKFRDTEDKSLTREVGRLLRWDMPEDTIRWAKTRSELLQQVLTYAQEFTSIKEWQNNHEASYAQAVKFQDDKSKSLTREVARLLNWDTRKEWSGNRTELLQQILPYAQGFTSLSSWEKGHGASYTQAIKFQDSEGKGLTQEVARLLGWDVILGKTPVSGMAKRVNWAKERDELLAQILPYAQRFKSLSEWGAGHDSSYRQARKFLDEDGKSLAREVGRLLGWDMPDDTIQWAKTPSELLKQILPYVREYKSLTEWINGHYRSYAQAKKFRDAEGKILTREVGRLLGWDMPDDTIQWAKMREGLIAQILPYAQDFTSLSEWEKGHGASYSRAVRFQDDHGKSLTREIGHLLGWDMPEDTIRWAKTRPELLKQILPYAQGFMSIKEWQNNHEASYAQAFTFQDAEGKGLQRVISDILGWKNEYPKQNILYLWNSHPTDHDSPITHGITKVGLTSELSSGENDRRISEVHKSCLPALTRPDVLLLTPIDGKAAENITRQIEMSALKSGIGDIDHGIIIKGDISGGRTEMRATSPIETLKLLLRMRKGIHQAGLASGASPESLHFMEARALADVSDYVRISPLARMSIFKENGAGQKILARMIKTLEADPSGFMNQRDTPMLDGDQLLYRMQRAGRELGISVPMMDDVPLETYKSFIGESIRVFYFEDLKEFDWAGLVRMREEHLVKIETGEMLDPADFDDAPAGRRRMDEGIEERFDLLHDRIVTKTMRGIAKGWLPDGEALLDGGLLEEVWAGIDPESRDALQASIRREVGLRVQMGGFEVVEEDPASGPENDDVVNEEENDCYAMAF